MLASKLIDDECRKQGQLARVNCGKICIWSVYNARWYPKQGAQVHQSGGGYVTGKDWPAGADTYYVIDRQLVAGELLQTFPAIAPDFVVGYRGFAMARVFRSDRLRSFDYSFGW
ncbi:MAG: hypothetical protein JWR80_7353 [Bradyrhizobium sp.]|nr:hypothetical protein [Bradyrhizobium sp.]